MRFWRRVLKDILVMGRALPPLASERLTEGAAGVTSVCTAHPMVIEAALWHGARAAGVCSSRGLAIR